jgi:hypothetical protein
MDTLYDRLRFNGYLSYAVLCDIAFFLFGQFDKTYIMKISVATMYMHQDVRGGVMIDKQTK